MKRRAPDVTFVSSNPGKAREVRLTLEARCGIQVGWWRRSLPEIQADSLQEVVRAKLDSIPRSSRTMLVEDSGLFIPALRGFPGVYSAPTFRALGVEGILRLLDGKDRDATFRTVAGVSRGGQRRLFVGRVTGRIPGSSRGSSGFGYDPIFVPRGSSRTFAEMTASEKERWSHRGKAMEKVARFLRTNGSVPGSRPAA